MSYVGCLGRIKRKINVLDQEVSRCLETFGIVFSLGEEAMARVSRVNFVDLDIDWVCSCGEENEFTSIVKTEDFVECLECGRKFRVKVEVTIEDEK